MILNLTQHIATPEQKEAGVVDLLEDQRQQLAELLTFNRLPTAADLVSRAEAVADIAMAFDMERDQGPIRAMIGGAPYFMGFLECALGAVGITPVYAFTVPCKGFERLPDGDVRSVDVFRHLGWVEV